MKNHQPLVSIIVPIFNAENFIEETINSVLDQSYNNIELVLVNDGSTDNSGSICENYAKANAKIKYFEKSNSGVSNTRNFGLDASSGEYIFFLDSDDTLPSDAISSLVEEIQGQECDAIYACHCAIYDEKTVPRLPRLPNGIYTYNDLKFKILDDGTITGILFGSVCGACYRASFLKENNINFQNGVKVNEDGLFNIQVVKSSKYVKVIDKCVYNYRQWKNSKKVPLQKDIRFEVSEPTIEKVVEQFDEKDVYDIQLKRRKVSVAFWNALRIQNSNSGFKYNISYLKALFKDEELKNCYRCLDYKCMNIFKKMLCFFMKHRLSFMFYISVRYFSPILSRIIKR